MTSIPIPNALSRSFSPIIPLQIPTFNVSASNPTYRHMLWYDSCRLRRECLRWRSVILVRASTDSIDSELAGNGDRIPIERNKEGFKKPASALQGIISSLPPAVFVMRNNIYSKIAVGLCIASAFLAIAARQIMLRKHSHKYPGSVADLVRRGQLRSDRRSISKPLKYEDPFNNPLVKVGKSNSTIEICGKVYRLAPVTLTKEEQSIHQKRRSRAYQWKRPTIFLKEGDSLPPDVDADTVKWIPANHPFATTVSDIDENLAQNNVYQKHGVPYRVKAEHEAMQKKLEALQSEQRCNKVEIDPSLVKDSERPFKPSSRTLESLESSPSTDQKCSSRTLKSDQDVDSPNNQTLQDEPKKL